MDDEPRDDDLDPVISFGLVARLRSSQIATVREFFSGLQGAKIVISKVAGPRRLWLIEADHEPDRDGRR